MALYNKDGRIEYITLHEMYKTIMLYEGIISFKKMFDKDGGCQKELMGRIKEMKNISREIRGCFPDYYGLSDKALNDLEEKCKKDKKIE